MSRGALLVSALGVTATAALFTLTNFIFFSAPISINAITIFWLLGMIYMVVSRLAVRELLRYRSGVKQRVLIYGAGTTGVHLAGSLREGGEYVPVAFVDHDATLQRSTVAGMKVYAPENAGALIKRQRITSVLLAIPSSSRRQRQEILKSLEHCPVHVRTVPDVSEIMSGKSLVTDVHDVDANDLLGRDPVPPNEALFDACIRGKNVLVTGAGGSIGSELCRQIVRLNPTRLVLLEISEASLYQIERELRGLVSSHKLNVEIVALLGNAHHRNRMREILWSYDVQTVYHAAAYKHVPIVEYNMVEGIHNNIFSTFYTADAALECKVETFVLISTDKAVNPTNVMGATKRFAELTLQALQSRSSFTRFCMVRFGNVLESSGSVVPLFREQIKRGEAVTVTHKDIIRYFMTIPEASQLVLQAGAMAKGGDVFVLNMGDPVRIDDLARRMISLMGRTVRDAEHPDGDIEIVYTGLRPAEKLYEELLIGTNVTPTVHPMIMRAMEHSLSWPEMKEFLEQMLMALDEFDCESARSLLKKAVREYRANNDIEDLVWQRGQNRPNVTDIRRHRARAQRVEQDKPRFNLN
jgi:FlaA1/EpsC-like NDP-sugar epimerase